MENGKLLGFDDFTEAYRAENPGALVEEKPAEPEKQPGDFGLPGKHHDVQKNSTTNPGRTFPDIKNHADQDPRRRGARLPQGCP